MGTGLLASAPTISTSSPLSEHRNPKMSAAVASGEPMDIASPTADGPTQRAISPAGLVQSADADSEGKSTDHTKNASPPDSGHSMGHNGNGSMNVSAPPPAAAALHQPKIVQTAFIHKLYNMLEDQNIQHLISWSSSADSFVMAPTPNFSKVLSYGTHTHSHLFRSEFETDVNPGNTSNIPTYHHSYAN
jgi:hypothetical protein